MTEIDEDERMQIILIMGFALGLATRVGEKLPFDLDRYKALLAKLGVSHPEQYVK